MWKMWKSPRTVDLGYGKSEILAKKMNFDFQNKLCSVKYFGSRRIRRCRSELRSPPGSLHLVLETWSNYSLFSLYRSVPRD